MALIAAILRTPTLKPMVTMAGSASGIAATARVIAVRNITSVIFGGDQLDEIYVTSMARVKHPAVHDHFAKEIKPQFLAGSLFRITGLGIRGLPESRFAG